MNLSDLIKTSIYLEKDIKEKLREASYLSKESMAIIINKILSSHIDEYLRTLKG